MRYPILTRSAKRFTKAPRLVVNPVCPTLVEEDAVEYIEFVKVAERRRSGQGRPWRHEATHLPVHHMILGVVIGTRVALVHLARWSISHIVNARSGRGTDETGENHGI